MAYRPTFAIPTLSQGFRAVPASFTNPARIPYQKSPSILQRCVARSASQWGRPSPRRPQPRYNRFGSAGKVYNLWYTSPGFRYGLGAAGIGGGIFYVANLETVPITGRRRFNCVSADFEKWISSGGDASILQQYRGAILPPHHPYSKLVNRVMSRLIPVSGLEGEKWEVRVIDDPKQKNAFVLPG